MECFTNHKINNLSKTLHDNTNTVTYYDVKLSRIYYITLVNIGSQVTSYNKHITTIHKQNSLS